MAEATLVNRWTDFDPLQEVILGIADNACFPPLEPACHSEFNDQNNKYGARMSHPFSEHLPWPTGPKLKKFIDAANIQLEGFKELLEGEGVTVRRPDPNLCNFNVGIKTPDFKSPTQYCAVCPRDVVMTVGKEIVEATMSKRSRFFEYRPLRPLIKSYFDRDPNMIWTAAPKPLMGDDSYNTAFWDWPLEERIERMHKYEYSLSEKEIMFDAADCLLIGDIMFVQHSMTTNLCGIRWLKRHFAQTGIQVQTLHFPYDLYPSHIDATFVALRDKFILTNPDRPVIEEEVKIFRQNDWRLIDVPFYTTTHEHPVMCQSSRWLSMNVFSIGPNKVVVEAGETPLINMLEQEYGFDVCPVPYRSVFEFGGSLHCSTWDVRRDGDKKNYFENREDVEDKGFFGLDQIGDWGFA